MDLGMPYTIRMTQQGFITPTGSDYAYRVYNVHFRCTTTPSNITLANRGSGTTATAATTDMLVVESDIGYGGVGNWDSSYGMLFTDGVFLKTGSSFSWTNITYVREFYK